jgi:hypothetical protein
MRIRAPREMLAMAEINMDKEFFTTSEWNKTGNFFGGIFDFDQSV